MGRQLVILAKKGDSPIILLPDDHRLIAPRLRRATNACYKVIGEILAEESLAPGQFSVLLMVQIQPDQTQSALAGRVHIERSTMVPIIDRLEKLGYVERRKKKSDRRAHAICITAKGTEVVARLKPKLHEIEKALDDLFGGEERERLIDGLERLEIFGRDRYKANRSG